MSFQLVLERSRLDGMVVAGVSYGVYFLLTIQSLIALTRRPKNGGKIVDHRLALIFYVVVTFILGTISFAANTKYTEMIWIDLSGVPGGPVELIENEMAYRINVLAICSGQVVEWIMQALFLYRCFALWNWARFVTIPMITLYISMIALSIAVLVEASAGTPFYEISVELPYLCIQVGLTVLFTVLVALRLLAMQRDMRRARVQFDSNIYDTILIMVVESAGSFSIFSVVFIVSFALHYNPISTICFLSDVQVQGIAQLFIIIRVATGRAVTQEWSTRVVGPPRNTIQFPATGESKDKRISNPEQGSFHTDSASEKVPEAADV